MADDARRRTIRWWPAVLIVAVEIALLAWFWTRDTGSLQHKVIPTFPVLFLCTLALLLWFLLFSRAPGRLRLVVFAVAVAAAGLGLLLLEIKGVDGNLVPVLGARWAGERTFDESTVALPSTGGSAATDYPQFYGPRRDATLHGPQLAVDWSVRPPRELWRREVGEGWSSFAIVGDAAITQEQRGEDELVVRYDLRTGRQVWIHGRHAPFRTTIGGSGPRATPTIADGRVYTLGASGALDCLELETGTPLWSRNVLEDHGAARPEWGLASSPLVAGDLVIVPLGDRATGLAAYRRDTGEPAWRTGDDRGSYCSPFLTTIAGREQVLIVNRSSVVAHDPSTGEIVWNHPWPNPGGGQRVSLPLRLDDQHLLVSAGYGVGSLLLRVLPDGDAFRVEQRWESRRMKSKFAPLVQHHGTVFGLDDGVLVALDPETGERRWKRGRYGHGQLILVGELLLIQAEDGDVVLVEANPEEHRELGRLEALSGKTWNAPALSGSLLLVRNDREAACYELPVEPSTGAP